VWATDSSPVRMASMFTVGPSGGPPPRGWGGGRAGQGVGWLPALVEVRGVGTEVGVVVQGAGPGPIAAGVERFGCVAVAADPDPPALRRPGARRDAVLVHRISFVDTPAFMPGRKRS